MQFTFRQLGTDDSQIYKDFRLRAFQQSPESFSSSLEDELDRRELEVTSSGATWLEV